jgi:putative FmdB family regulatory protein
MPFYSYNCGDCKKTFKAFHSPDELESKCVVCKSQNITKQLSLVRTVQKHDSSAGNRVEKFIEESREVLQQQMADAKKELK